MTSIRARWKRTIRTIVSGEKEKQKQKRGEMNERACNKMLDYLGWKDMRYRTWLDAIKELNKQLLPSFKTLKILQYILGLQQYKTKKSIMPHTKKVFAIIFNARSRINTINSRQTQWREKEKEKMTLTVQRESISIAHKGFGKKERKH